jgi:glycerophosphoryl diester phosphodiesterase
MKNWIFVFLLLNALPQYCPAQTPTFDWQGHRGARGLMPENTIPAFLKGLDLGVKTLELDIAISADNQLIISHEPWLNHDICLKADGTPVLKAEAESFKIKNMTADSVKKCDCGSRGNPNFPEQQKLVAYKPTLAEMVVAVKQYCKDKNRPLPYFNIEIKSQPNWDGIFTPSVNDFAKLVVDEIKRLDIKNVSTIQSFDPRALEATKKLDTTLPTVLLASYSFRLNAYLSLLSFKPDVFSPSYSLVTKKMVKQCHEKGIKIVPWTVNETSNMLKLMKLGVDGIITDYPNRIPILKK